MDLILLKNHKIKRMDAEESMTKKKLKITKHALIDLYSDILGSFKYKLPVKTIHKLLKVEEFKLSYEFMNGIDTGEEEFEPPILEYEYGFDDYRKLITKFVEITVSEQILNEYFWCRNAFECYKYQKMRITIRMKDSFKFIKFKSLVNFFKYFDFDIAKTSKKYLEIADDKNKSKWKLTNTFKIKNETYINFYGRIFIRLNDAFKSVRSLVIKATTYITDDDIDIGKLSKSELADVVDTEFIYQSDDIHMNSFRFLFELPMADFVLSEIYESEELNYKLSIKDRIFYKNGNGDNTKWHKLRNTLFSF